jgi:glycosyltransferase involved in cell wall biosynthesis
MSTPGSRRLRVLLVAKGPPDRGGIATFVADLCAGDLARAHELTFLNVAHHGTPEGGRASLGNVRRTLADALLVWRRSAGQDIVHINSALTPTVTVLRAGLLALAARLRGSRVLMHAHGGNISSWLTSRRSRAVLRAAMLPVDLVVAVWDSGCAALSDVLGEHRVALVTNGVDTSRFQPAPPTARVPRVLYVGLLTPRKGVLDLVEASRTLRREGVEHELLLLGGTPDEGPDAAETVRDAAAGTATLLGTRPPEQMPAAYAEGDVQCLPSWWEAMPLSVLEGMASGLPVVATDVGEVPRMVEQGVTGYVVPARSPDALASALRKLLTDPDQRRRMGAAGRRRVEERFSSAATAQALGQLYADLTRGRR